MATTTRPKATRLSPSQIAHYAWGAGFKGAEIPVATAVALAESGGNPAAHCLNCGGVPEDSRGLWQINLNAHPEYTSDDLYNPAVNAKDAHEVYLASGSSFAPWSTFTSGSYRGHLDAATTASSGLESRPAPKHANCQQACADYFRKHKVRNPDMQGCIQACEIGLTPGFHGTATIGQGLSSGDCATFKFGIGPATICFDKPLAALGMVFGAVVVMFGVYILFRGSIAEAATKAAGMVPFGGGMRVPAPAPPAAPAAKPSVLRADPDAPPKAPAPEVRPQAVRIRQQRREEDAQIASDIAERRAQGRRSVPQGRGTIRGIGNEGKPGSRVRRKAS